MDLGGTRAARTSPLLLNLCWSGVVPAILAGLFVRLGLPDHVSANAGPTTKMLVRAAHEHALGIGVGLLVLFAALVGYWRRQLPGVSWLAPPGSEAAAARPRTRRARELAILALAIGLAAVAALFLRSSIAESYEVVSGSMVPTLEPGDRLLVDKRAYRWRSPFGGQRVAGRLPDRGDVIVFRATGTLDADGDAAATPNALVKRVVALPGEHVTMIDGHPVIDGRQVPSCDAGAFVYFSAGRMTRGRLAVEFPAPVGAAGAYLTVQEPGTPRSFTGYTVKPGEVFVLGDNRGSSNDSRSWGEGRGAGVPLSLVDGRGRAIAFGTTRAGHVDWHRVAQSLGLDVRLPGFDVAALKAGIERCLAVRADLRNRFSMSR